MPALNASSELLACGDLLFFKMLYCWTGSFDHNAGINVLTNVTSVALKTVNVNDTNIVALLCKNKIVYAYMDNVNRASGWSVPCDDT